MAVVVEFSIIPLGEKISVSEFLAEGLKELEKRGVRYSITPMSTVFEAENIEVALEVVREAHEAVFKSGVKRVVTSVKIDDRRDIERDMEEKVRSLESVIERK
ncbi:MAG: MTH1187 family thiamine-binding protein [Thermoproteota archaeon]